MDRGLQLTHVAECHPAEWERGRTCGTIYVLRSQSHHPAIAPHREIIHKIGVTGGEVDIRIANAESDPTYLFAGVEVVATDDDAHDRIGSFARVCGVHTIW